MSKTIPSSEVRKIINEHKKILSELKQAQNTFTKLEAKVVTDVDGLLDEQAMELVSQIPVEELNRNKSGIRIKALKSAGYENVAQVHKAHVMKITNIEGIGEDSACTIKAIAADYFKKARENSHIRLDFGPGVDLKKQLMVKELILTLYKLLLGSSSRINCDYVLFTYKDTVEAEMAKLGAITGLRRIFCSSVKREMAEDAYDYLSELLDSEYTEKIKGLQHADYEITIAGSTQAVDDYKLNPIPYYTLLDKICPGVLGEDNYLSDLPDELIGEIGRENLYPEGLRCSLRRYQEWGVKYILHQEKVLLGDEMGLGKTVQAIAAMVSLRNIGETHFMVICPASVLTNWCREIEKHSTLTVVKVHGPGREEVFSSWMKNGGVAVTTYESTAKLKTAFYFHFCMLVVDEAHYIKNPEAARTKNVKRLAMQADRLLFMTGTALENNVDEMIALMKILNPDVAQEAKKIAFMSAAPLFRKAVSPVYFRRKREDVLKELPDLIENTEWCAMKAAEYAKYVETVYSRNFMAMRRVSWNVPDLKNSTKAARMLEIIEDAKEENRKIIVFSFFLETLDTVVKVLEDKIRCMDVITGAVSPNRRQAILDEFEKAPAGTVLPAQIQSGGTGLNIQTASVVILCEPQLKPSIENQAVSRAYRMGQTRSVLVYRLVSEHSVDEAMLDILSRKQKEFDAFADESDAARESIELEKNEIDTKTQNDIIEAEISRIHSEKRI